MKLARGRQNAGEREYSPASDMSMRPLIQTETGLSTGSELQCQTEKPSVEHQY